MESFGPDLHNERSAELDPLSGIALESPELTIFLALQPGTALQTAFWKCRRA